MPNSQGVVMTNRANKVEGKHIHNYSTFNDTLSYRLYNTLRFGDLTPSFVMEGVEKDDVFVNSRDLIDSLSLKAPFKGSIRKIKESFMVPNMAILPMNWERIYVQPSNGEDVPRDANCVIFDFGRRYSIFWTSLYNLVVSNIPAADATLADFAPWYTAFLRMLVIGEYIYSHGSLINVCGAKFSRDFRLYHDKLPNASYDEFFDYCISVLFSGVRSGVLSWNEGNVKRDVKFNGLSGEPMPQSEWYGSLRSMLENLRENPIAYFGVDFFFESQYWDEGDIGQMGDGLANYITYLRSELLGDNSDGVLSQTPLFFESADEESDIDDDLKELNPNALNLSRLLAYQIVCFHYYSNSSIDFMYSAEDYRQYVRYLCNYSLNSNGKRFGLNGTVRDYDFLSGACLSAMFFDRDNSSAGVDFTWLYAYLSASFTGVTPGVQNPLLRFVGLASIFGFRKSLRYGDYFVGSRPRPLAPINTDVAVNNNLVSVIDVTRNIQAQRFGNAVMRSRQKIEEYVESLFGKRPAPDYHNPFFLSRETETIFGDEVQNTAEGQITNPNSRTANLAANTGQFTFTFHNDDMHPCIYLQIISFDIKRAYTRTIERQMMHVDRYDMFNPDFQYIGDQPIYGTELGYIYGSTYPHAFGYQTRDEEYKQRFDQAAGGFVENLPGWILTDRDQSIHARGVLDPDFIRSYNTELDQFFLSLTGFSLGSYFHFICITNNNINAKRAMAVDPQILA